MTRLPSGREDDSVGIGNVFIDRVEITQIKEHPPGVPKAISEYFKYPSDLTFQLVYSVPDQDFDRTLDFQGELKVAPGKEDPELLTNRYTKQLASLKDAVDFQGVPLVFEDGQWALSEAFKKAILETPFRILRYPKKGSKYRETHIRYYPQHMAPKDIWEDFKGCYDAISWPKNYDPRSGMASQSGGSSPSGLSVTGSPPRSPSQEFQSKPEESNPFEDFDDDVPF